MPDPRTSPTRRDERVRLAVITAVAAYVGLLLLVPLAALVATVAAHPAEALAGLMSADALDALGRTLIVTVCVVVCNVTLGVGAALLIVRDRFHGRRLLDAVLDLPLAVSPVMTGLAMLLLFGRGGWLHAPLAAMGVVVAFQFPAILLASLFVTLPFTLREVALVLHELGTSEEEAAATLGATPWQTFWRVTLPNLRHAIAVGATLTSARSLGEFGAVLVVGGAIAGRTQTATTFIHAAMEERQDPAAYAMSLVLAALAIALLAALQKLQSHRGTP
jgi:sulfate transport system permease protein